MLKKGDKIGEYILVEKLGEGGFADVWKAEKRTALSTTPFALKFFRPKDTEEVQLKKIKKEIAVSQKLSGLPSVISIIEANQTEDYFYIVSEYADEGSLEKWIKNQPNKKAKSIDEAVGIIIEILKGLEQMHKQGVIHRDLKPANILRKREYFCLADFGVSREMKSHSKATGTAGTLEYMPPEAFNKKPSISAETDIWSVGVMLQQLLTGELPFPQDEIPALMAAIVMDEPEPMPKEIPLGYREIVNKTLQREREDRFHSARKMIQALNNPQKFLDEHTKQEPKKYTIIDEEFDKTEILKTEPTKETPNSSTNPAKTADDYFELGLDCGATDYDCEVEIYSRAIELKADFAQAYNSRGCAYHNKGEYGRAIKDYNKAIEINPNDATAYNNLGNLLDEDESRGKEAEEAYKKAIEINPNHVTAYYNLGVLLAKDESRWKEAEEAYQKAIEIKPNDAFAYNNLGTLLAKDESRWKEAEKAYNKAIEINPNHASAYNNLGNWLVKDERRRKEAEEAYKKAIEINPNYATAYNNLGLLLFKDERRRKEAEEAYNKAIELNPNYASAYYNLGVLLFKDERRRKEAEEAYNKAIEINPNLADAYYNLGTLLGKDESRWKEAEEAYKKAIEINPNDADAYFNFARLRSLSELEENKDEAFEFLLNAVELDSEFKGKAKNDSDFDFIRDDERFKEIVGD